jgi:chromate transporter
MLGAAGAGWAGGRIAPEKFRLGGTRQWAQVSYGPALIDDDTPPPGHARFSWLKLAAGIGLGLGIGSALLLALAACFGVESPVAQMGVFFSKAALLTFGGAYAVLPYVVQGAVVQAHWLTPSQMMDGLALGETTPGPLIMIVTYVGFLGGWQTAAGDPFLPAIAGAVVATVFTFLPSFVFVLAGGPLVEATRDEVRFTAPLTAISAAVVGVIASLALFFARQVFRLDAGLPHWDYGAALICTAASFAMLRFRLGAIQTLFGCAIAGVVVSYLA